VSVASVRPQIAAVHSRSTKSMGDTLRHGRGFIAGLLAVCAFALLLRWTVADVPLERDEGEYAYTAQRWLRGEVPYRDAFDQKPPGVFVVYALIETLIGTNPAALHWGAQLYTLGTLILIALVGRHFLNDRAGLLAAFFASFMTVDNSVLGNAANTEMFMILPLSGGFLCAILAVDRSSAGWALLSGVLGCLAMQFKQVSLQNAVYNGLLLLVLGRPRIRLCVAYCAGGIAAIVPTVAYFASVGALHEFYDCVIGHNIAYAQRVPLADYPDYFWYYFRVIVVKWLFILAFAVVGLVDRCDERADGRRSRWILGTWLLFSFLGVCTGGYFRDHYFFQVIPAVSVLAGRGVALLAGRLVPDRPARLAWTAAGVAVAAGIAWMPWYFRPGDPIEKVTSIYGGCPFGESLAVADYIAAHTKPDDTIFVYGSEPQIPYYANRKSASRYIFVYPLMTPFPDTPARQAGVLDELKRNRPRMIVVAKQESSFFRDEETPKLLTRMLGELLTDSYHLIGYVDAADTAVQESSEPIVWVNQLPRPGASHTLAIWERTRR
jgi:4-amino-4-deoxy-L-arabinose transferase-like glycosyltransferase